MTSTNLDLVRSVFTAWEQGDYSAVEWAHPEIEYVFADGPHPGRWTGLNGMAAAARDFLSVWDELRIEATDYRDLDDQRVLVLTERGGRGKRSGVELDQMRTEGAHLFQLRSGKVMRVVVYMNRENALSDLGLAE